MPEIWFPHLHIQIMHLNRIAFTLLHINDKWNGINVYWYGILIALAFVVGINTAYFNSKRFGFDGEIFFDFFIYAIIVAIIGARFYYVIFSWGYYSKHLNEILALRDGGLGIYGGIIAEVILTYFYTKWKKINFFSFADYAVPGIAIGQAIGRWGNFFNKEAFGGYTDNIFAMRIRTDVASFVPDKLTDTIVNIGGASYIQVHPTFLYESCWNILVCIFLLWFSKKKRFKGEIFCLYFICYGIGRFFIESLRMDQLLFMGIPISMAVSFIFALAGATFIIIKRKKKTENKN